MIKKENKIFISFQVINEMIIQYISEDSIKNNELHRWEYVIDDIKHTDLFSIDEKSKIYE